MTNIDAILKTTEGHTPGPWREFDEIESGCGEAEGLARCIAQADWNPNWKSPDAGEDDNKKLVVSVCYYDGSFLAIGEKDTALIVAAPALRAEVLRLRDVEAAWEWLAVKSYQVKRVGNEYVAYRWGFGPHGEGWSTKVATAADPVALAKALGKDWRVK